MGIERFAEIKKWSDWQIDKDNNGDALLLGEGSFGKVYQAIRKEKNMTTFSAIKVISIPKNKEELNRALVDHPEEDMLKHYFDIIADKCVEEIKIMETFKGNSHIVNIDDYAVLKNLNGVGRDIFIKMELLTSFNDYISTKPHKKLTETEVIKLGLHILTALEMFSTPDKLVVHRDVKPGNIFVSKHGCFKLGDFGIARELSMAEYEMTRDIGTHSYMDPEVCSGRYGEGADTYSLGIVLYQLLNNNRIPFMNQNKELNMPSDKRQAIEKRLSGAPLPPPLEASEAMAQVILKACAYDSDDRYENATEFKKALASVQTDKLSLPSAAPISDDETEVVNISSPIRKLPSADKPSKPDGFKVITGVCESGVVSGMVKGRLLHTILNDIFPRAMSEHKVLNYAVQLCKVFSSLHNWRGHEAEGEQTQLVYGDCEPVNIVITNDMQVFLIDFDEKKDTVESRSGKRSFSAPEQADTELMADIRTDIYRLGATLYCMLTGVIPDRPPHPVSEVNPRSHISIGMRRVVMKCLMQDPRARYQSMSELLEALNGVNAYKKAYRARKRIKSVKIIACIICIVLCLLLIRGGVNDMAVERQKKYDAKIAKMFEDAEDAHNAGEYDEASILFSGIIEEAPNEVDGYIGAFRANREMRDYKGNKDLLEDVLEKGLFPNPSEELAKLNHMLGLTYYDMEKFPTAIKYINEALKIGGDNSDYVKDLAMCYINAGSAKKIETDDLRNRLVGDDGIFVTALVHEYKGEYGSALECYERCFNASNEDLRSDAYKRAAMIYHDNPNLDPTGLKKIDILEQAENEERQGSRLSGRIYRLELLGDWYSDMLEKSGEQRYRELALDSYVNLITDYPGMDIEAYIQVFDMYMEDRRLDDCEDILNTAAQKHGRDYLISHRQAVLEWEKLMAAGKPVDELDFSLFAEYYLETEQRVPPNRDEREVMYDLNERISLLPAEVRNKYGLH